MALRALMLCDGYGGFELGLRYGAGVDVSTVARVERDSYAAAVLVARMEAAHLDSAPLWDDLESFSGGLWRGRVDLVCAGFPCQPWSSAGARGGVDDPRWLWPSIARIVADVEPRFVFLENVPELNAVRWDKSGVQYVLQDLADLGFDAEWGLYSAADVGATHGRGRFWLLAHTDGDGREGVGRGVLERCDVDGRNGTRRGGTMDWPPGRDDVAGWAEWIAAGGPEPVVCRGANGRPPWLADALHLGGNGLVPLAAGDAFRQLVGRLGVSVRGG